MEITAGIIIGAAILLALIAVLFEYRIRKPDVLPLYESKGQIGLRQGLLYPRHFSLPLERTTHPIKLTIEATAVGNLEVRMPLHTRRRKCN